MTEQIKFSVWVTVEDEELEAAKNDPWRFFMNEVIYRMWECKVDIDD